MITGGRIFHLLLSISVALLSFLVIAKEGVCVDVVPILNLRLAGGQYFFNSEPSAFGGNAYLLFSPMIRFGENTNILLSYYSSYQGTKDVVELVGGGTLYQQSLENTFSLKFIQALTPTMKVKLRGSYGMELLQQTKDETWGKGLFDYNKSSLSAEVEKEFFTLGPFEKFNFYVSYFKIKFPNYQSLAEEMKKRYGLEFVSNVGENVLDFNGLELAVNNKLQFSTDFLLKFNIGWLNKSFVDQKLVVESGEYINDLRKDENTYVSLLSEYSRTLSNSMEMTINNMLSVSQLMSNQNHYYIEGTLVKFLHNYYSYTDFVIVPVSVDFRFPRVSLSVEYDLKYRKYMSRPVQDEKGNFGTEKIYTVGHIVRTSINFLLYKRIKLFTNVNFCSNVSNMKDERVYKYNYTTFNYLAGLSFEY
jgi:hypothetical protein